MTVEEAFRQFLQQCYDMPPLETRRGIEFSLPHWVQFVKYHHDMTDEHCRLMLRPYEFCGWIKYTEMLHWVITSKGIAWAVSNLDTPKP